MCTNIYTVHTKCTFLKTQGIVCVCVWNPPTTHTTLSSKHKALFVGVYKHIHMHTKCPLLKAQGIVRAYAQTHTPLHTKSTLLKA